MTRPKSSKTQISHDGTTDQLRSQWLVPLVPVALGCVILVAAATTGHALGGLVWFAVLAALGALTSIAVRLEAARRTRQHVEDEREAIINTRAMSIAGTVLVIALTGCTAFTLARGESPGPYPALLAVGGIAYIVALVALGKNVP